MSKLSRWMQFYADQIGRGLVPPDFTGGWADPADVVNHVDVLLSTAPGRMSLRKRMPPELGRPSGATLIRTWKPIRKRLLARLALPRSERSWALHGRVVRPKGATEGWGAVMMLGGGPSMRFLGPRPTWAGSFDPRSLRSRDEETVDQMLLESYPGSIDRALCAPDRTRLHFSWERDSDELFYALSDTEVWLGGLAAGSPLVDPDDAVLADLLYGLVHRDDGRDITWLTPGEILQILPELKNRAADENDPALQVFTSTLQAALDRQGVRSHYGDPFDQLIAAASLGTLNRRRPGRFNEQPRARRLEQILSSFHDELVADGRDPFSGGYCGDAVDAVLQQEWDPPLTLLSNEDVGSPLVHNWVFDPVSRLHFDLQRPRGVRSWRDLPALQAGSANLAPSARTAITRGGPSAPVKALVDKGLVRGKVLDFGSGRGEDARWLRRQGFEVTAYDPHHGPERLPSGRFDTVLSTYVLNVLPPAEQKKVERQIRDRLAPGGRALVTVRRDVCSGNATGVQSCVRRPWKSILTGAGFQTYQFGAAGRANKSIGRKRWAAKEAAPASVQRRARALAAAHGFEYDLIRWGDGALMLGRVPDLGRKPDPELVESLTRTSGGRVRRQTYADPPVYHRTELMLAPGDPRAPRLAAETAAFERKGWLSRPDIGRRSSWRAVSGR